MYTGLRRALLALALLLPGAAGAQEVRGRVVDDRSARALRGAQVLLLDAGEEPVGRAAADRDGRFTVRAPGPGVYHLRAERVGYRATLTEGLDLGDQTVLEVVVRVAEAAVPLAPLSVTARRESPREVGLERRGFYDRQKLGLGHFLDRERVERNGALTTTQLLAGLPGITIVSVGSGSLPSYAVRMRRAMLNSLQGGCSPSLWVDGVRMGSADRLNDVVSPDDVEGIEVYRGPSETPAECLGGNCGVIVVWTRTGMGMKGR